MRSTKPDRPCIPALLRPKRQEPRGDGRRGEWPDEPPRVVDSGTVHTFASALAQCDEDPCIQALDLSAVEFFASAGVWCFIDRGWPIQPHVSIIASKPVRRVLTICDMEFLLARHGWRAACA